MKRFVCVVLAAAACGGGSKQVHELTPEEELHAKTPPATPVGVAPVGVAPPGETPPATQPSEPVAPPAPSGPVIELRNEAQEPLNFGVTKGWGLVIFGYTGKPPKAKAVTLFESVCSASCDAPAEEICPVCEQPQTKKEEQEQAKTETIAPGATFKVPWDGQLRVYEKAPGKKCKCWKKAEPPADSYTIKACGLRPPKIKGKPSRPVCVETVVSLGSGPPPAIVLSFTK